jgi:hypothetical protein
MSTLVGAHGTEASDARQVQEEEARAQIWGTPEHKRLYGCKVCGVICAVSPGPGEAVCEKHCEDHDYQYEPGEGRHCVHCWAQPPDDWFDRD